MQFQVKLSRMIDRDLALEIEKEAAYVSPYLCQLKVTTERTAVDVKVSEGIVEHEVRGKVERYLETMLAKFRKIDEKVYFRHQRQDNQPFATDVYNELKQRGWLFELGPGHIGLTGLALILMRKIDETFAKLYYEHFGAIECIYPALIRADLLSKCGYLESHPNTVSLVTHLINDFDVIEEFRQANVEDQKFRIPNKEAIATPHICLNPAACFPCYQSFRGQDIEKEGRVLTWLGRVFRYESTNITGLDRLWEFNVRELVFIGNDEFVTTSRQKFIQLIEKKLNQWDLECQIETATDVFFATVSGAKTFWQQSLEVKYEIRLAVEPEKKDETRSIAGGSINTHNNFFGNRFNISCDGQPAFTGCVGLGLERWLLAIFTQHGFEPENWPALLQSDVFG